MPERFDLHARNIVYTCTDGAQMRTLLEIPAIDIAQGTLVSVQGTSGSGKTTLLKVLSGIVRIDDAKVCWGNTNLNGLSENQRDEWRGRHCGFLFQDFGSFVIVGTTLGVAEDYVLCTRRSDHLGRNFARECAFGLVGTVLGTYTDTFGVDSIYNRYQVSERSGDDYIAFGGYTGQSGIDFFSQSHALLYGRVHFPVSCNNVFSHFVFTLKG